MEAYQEALTAVKKLSTETFKNRAAYVNHFKGIITVLEKLAEGYAEIGHNKLAQGVISIRNKMITLSRRVELGKVSSITDIREAAKEAVQSLITLSPKTADKAHTKAGIKDQKLFKKFNKKKVHLTTDSPTAAFKLEKAPLILLFKTKISPIANKLLKSFNATFYQGTNMVSIPSVPILVLNRNIVPEKDYDKVIKSILKSLKRTDLAVFKDQGVVKRNYIAFLVFEPRDAETMSVIFFDQLQSKELWVS